jgi:Mobilization protein NikA
MEQPAAPSENVPARRSRRGTETRQKQRRVTYRLTEAEYAEVEIAASQAGLTLSSYARARTVADPTTQSRYRPSVEVMALLKLRGELNKIGSNIFQLMRHVNFGRLIDPDGEVAAAFADYRETTAVIRAALRHYEQPQPEPPQTQPEPTSEEPLP